MEVFAQRIVPVLERRPDAIKQAASAFEQQSMEQKDDDLLVEAMVFLWFLPRDAETEFGQAIRRAGFLATVAVVAFGGAYIWFTTLMLGALRKTSAGNEHVEAFLPRAAGVLAAATVALTLWPAFRSYSMGEAQIIDPLSSNGSVAPFAVLVFCLCILCTLAYIVLPSQLSSFVLFIVGGMGSVLAYYTSVNWVFQFRAFGGSGAGPSNLAILARMDHQSENRSVFGYEKRFAARLGAESERAVDIGGF